MKMRTERNRPSCQERLSHVEANVPNSVPRILRYLHTRGSLLSRRGGIRLVSAGGSPYYVIVGIAFFSVAVLLFLRSAGALWAYAAIILGTMAWAVWEVGLDWWQLAPRGDFVVILGLFLSLPWVAVGAKSTNGNYQAIFRSGWLALVASIALSGVVAVLALATPSHDLNGSLPDRTAATGFAPQPGLSGGEWIA